MNSQQPMAMVRFGSPGFKPLAEKATSVSVTERMRLLEMAILWVYLPRYSMALPKPLNVSLMKGHQSLRQRPSRKAWPAGRFPESGTGAREGKGAILIEPVQEGKVFPLELVPQDKDGQEELPFAPADPAVRGKAAAGEDAVHVDMVEHLLVPGMEHLDDAGLGAQVSLVGAELEERLRAAFVEEPVKVLLVGEDEGVQLMGEGKDHMEVRRVNDLGPTPVHPELLLDGLAVGAAAVAAGIIMDLHVAAVWAEAPVAAQLPGLAAHDGMCSLTLDVGLRGTQEENSG